MLALVKVAGKEVAVVPGVALLVEESARRVIAERNVGSGLNLLARELPSPAECH